MARIWYPGLTLRNACPEMPFDCIEQHSSPYWFCNKFRGSGALAFRNDFSCHICRQNQDRYRIGRRKSIKFECFESTHHGHGKVEQSDIEACVLERIKSGLAVVDDCDSMATALQNQLCHPLIGGIVFGNKNSSSANLCNRRGLWHGKC